MGWFVIMIAALMLGYAGWEAARSGFRQPSGWPRLLAAAVLAWAWFTIGLQILGVIGLLNRPAILVHCALGVGISSLMRVSVTRRDSEKFGGWFWSPSSLIALALTLATVMDLSAISLLVPPRIVSDGPIYHLFFAAKWWKAGQIFLIASPFGENAATYFPANGDLFFAGLMTLLGGDQLARIGQSPFFLLAGLAAYGISRRLGASSSSSLIATCLFLTGMPLLLFSFEANVDTIFVAGYLAAVAFGIRYLLDGRDWRSLVLGGLAAGGAWGTKATATTFLPPLILALGLIVMLGKESKRSKLVQLSILILSTLAPCGFWFVRNLWLTGNPLYPMHLELFGRVILKGWYGTEAMRRSQFYLPVDDWRSLCSIIFMVVDARSSLLFGLALTGVWSFGRRSHENRGVVWAISLLAILNIAIYWLVIPYRTQQRFMLQAAGLAAAPVALLLDRGRFWRWLGVSLLVIHVLTPQNWPWTVFRPGSKAPWELSPLIPTTAAALLPVPLSPGEFVAFWNAPGGAALMATVAVAIGVSFVCAGLWGFVGRRPSLARGIAAGGCLVLSYTIIATFVTSSSRLPLGRAYPKFNDYQRGWMTLERLSPPEGTRVAYAGTNLPYYLMAAGQRNDVFYVNIDGPADWQMHDFHRTAASRGEPTIWDYPRPGWDRIRHDYKTWLLNLRSRKIRLLVVAKANWMDGKFNIADDEEFPIERVWADAHPQTFELVYPVSEPDRLMRIYRVREK